MPTETRGQRLAVALKAHGITQATLADRLNIRSPMISRICAGKQVPTLDWLVKAAKAIGCDLSELDPEIPPQVPVKPGRKKSEKVSKKGLDG